MDTSVNLLLSVVKTVLVQVSVHCALDMNNIVSSEHSQCMKIDYLLIHVNNFDGYEGTS